VYGVTDSNTNETILKIRNVDIKFRAHDTFLE